MDGKWSMWPYLDWARGPPTRRNWAVKASPGERITPEARAHALVGTVAPAGRGPYAPTAQKHLAPLWLDLDMDWCSPHGTPRTWANDASTSVQGSRLGADSDGTIQLSITISNDRGDWTNY